MSVFIVVWVLSVFVYTAAPERQESTIIEEVKNILQTKIAPNNRLTLPNLFKRKLTTLFEQGLACFLCQMVAKFAIVYAKLGSIEVLTVVLKNLCVWMKIGPKNVCDGTIDSNIDSIVYIFRNKDLSPKCICSTILQSYNCYEPKCSNWTIEIDDGPPKPVRCNKSTHNEINVLQISDVHYQPQYKEGSNAACGSYVCCEIEYGKPRHFANTAGYWGDYRNCDTPWHSIVDVVNQIAKFHNNDLSYIYFTGDIIDHNIWKTSKGTTMEIIRNIYALLQERFGSIPVYPILGNHESHPINVFAPLNITDEKLSTQWLFNFIADEWSRWLPPETKKTILSGGYYTVLIKSGFRIIALNNNVCYMYNWWLLYDDRDPYGQLQWLADTLLEAEKSNEVVHILAHMPPGDVTCHQLWTVEYNRIINRFASIVKGQFNGHTHIDQFVLFYNSSVTMQAINVAFNGGSITTYVNVNPNYKIYKLNGQTMDILDYDVWTYNLTEANDSQTPPYWYKLYSFREAYGTKSLCPDELSRSVWRMATNKDLQELYFRNSVRDGESSIQQGCDFDCHKQNLCDIVSPVAGNDTYCKAITQLMDNGNNS